MTKEQFLNKWHFTGHCLILKDLEAVISTEIEKAKVQLEKQNAMVQEKQLRELFKYIEANWDVCVSQVDKTDIKRIFGGVLCEDIMNDTLHEVKAEPALNPIEQAYERGEKIRCNYWGKDEWIKKHSKTESITECNKIYKNLEIDFDFATHPEKWELYTEPAEQPSSQVKHDNSFDRDRFERIFCSVVANGGHELECKEAINLTQVALSELDAFYINQEKGGNNG